MPAAVPVIAAFAAAAPAVSAVIAGTAGFAAYATVAGAVLTGVGALTGKKDLMKIGSVMTLGGGLATAAGIGAGADMGIGSMGAGGMGAQAIENAASGGLADAAGAAAVSQVPELAMDGAAASASGAGADAAQQAAASVAKAQAAATPPVTNLAGMAEKMAPQAPAAGGMTGEFATQGTTAAPVAATSRLAEMSKGITSSDLSSWWDRAKAAGSGVANFMEKNPNLMKVGGDMLSSMYGPAAEKLDWDKSLYERGRRNLNSPVAMTYTRTGGK